MRIYDFKTGNSKLAFSLVISAEISDNNPEKRSCLARIAKEEVLANTKVLHPDNFHEFYNNVALNPWWQDHGKNRGMEAANLVILSGFLRIFTSAWQAGQQSFDTATSPWKAVLFKLVSFIIVIIVIVIVIVALKATVLLNLNLLGRLLVDVLIAVAFLRCLLIGNLLERYIWITAFLGCFQLEALEFGCYESLRMVCCGGWQMRNILFAMKQRVLLGRCA